MHNIAILSLAIVLSISAAAEAAPDEVLLGKEQGYPVGTQNTSFANEATRVGTFTHIDSLWPHHTLAKAAEPSVFKRAAMEPPLRYRFEGKDYTVDDYLQHQRAMGLLIIRDGKILVERYQYARRPEDRFLSNSMAKSITSLGIGFALEDGKIASLDDKVAHYVPELRGNAYGDTTIRDLLRMSSGLKFEENYNGKSDDARFFQLATKQGTIAAVKAFGDREAAAGTHFHYASIESVTLGLVLAHATGKSLSAYVEQKLWQPMGAEADATWVVDPHDMEIGSGHFSATLRDYGRLGMLLANDGELNGKQILPKSYLLEATDWHLQPLTFSPGQATPYYGYGYQFWTFPGERRRFALLGIYGQVIYVDPASKTVLVQTAAAKHAKIGEESMAKELHALWDAVDNQALAMSASTQ